MSRRSFLGSSAGALFLCGVAPAQESFDILIKGGQIVDPSQGLSGVRDLGIVNGRIARIAESITASTARSTIDASGKWVTPGLIDAHVHVYEGVARVGISPDVACVARGATTVVDAGSAGANTFGGFRRYVVEPSATRVKALLHLSAIGMASMRELPVLDFANVQAAASVIETNRDVIVGIKLRMTPNVGTNQELEALARAIELGDAVRLPIMVHIQRSNAPLAAILDRLRPGDIVTHALRAEGSILDERFRIRPEVVEARKNGIYFDVGHGAGNFSFRTAERALDQGFLPDTISSDVHRGNFDGPVFDLATTLAKFLYLGLSMEEVVERATIAPSRIFSLEDGLGSLATGAGADIAVLEHIEEETDLVDSTGESRRATSKLVPVLTIRGGRIHTESAIETPALGR